MQVVNINLNLNVFGYTFQQHPTLYDLIPSLLIIALVLCLEPVGIVYAIARVEARSLRNNTYTLKRKGNSSLESVPSV